MKTSILFTLVALTLAAATPVMARGGGGGGHGHSSGGTHYVSPHVTKNGTYVEGHMQTNPNGTKLDNWSTKGNVNPYTGQPGTKDPYGSASSTARTTTPAMAPQTQQPAAAAPDPTTPSGPIQPWSPN